MLGDNLYMGLVAMPMPIAPPVIAAANGLTVGIPMPPTIAGFATGPDPAKATG